MNLCYFIEQLFFRSLSLSECFSDAFFHEICGHKENHSKNKTAFVSQKSLKKHVFYMNKSTQAVLFSLGLEFKLKITIYLPLTLISINFF